MPKSVVAEVAIAIRGSLLSRRDVFLTLSAPLGVLAAVIIAGLASRPETMTILLRDFATSVGVHPATGAVSSLGAFLWFSTVAVMLFSIAILKNLVPKSVLTFLCGGAVLSLYLGIDDFFLVHEYLLPGLGIKERYVMLCVATGFAAYVLIFWRSILRQEWLWLAGALFFLAASAAADLFFSRLSNQQGAWLYVIEDGLKLLGITCWARFHCGVAYFLINQRLAGSKPAG